MGNTNGRECLNDIIKNYLKSKIINFIHRKLCNLNSNGVLDRFHKTVKDALYCLLYRWSGQFLYQTKPGNTNKKYNNHIYSSPKSSPHQIFNCNCENLFNKILINFKETYKSREKLEKLSWEWKIFMIKNLK